MKSTPFVSVIIPVYNDPMRLKKCLQALEDQTCPKDSYEVIVVDNGSDESIKPLVAEFSQAKAGFEAHPGSYAARNKGLLLARGEIIAFTDSDCIPALDWIEKGVKNLLGVPNCGIVGGKIEFFFRNPERPTPYEVWDSMTYLRQRVNIEERNHSVTANLFTFKHVFEHVGRFDKNLKSLGDYEWGQRVASFGYALIYADDVCVGHPARYSFVELHRRMARTAEGLENVKQESPFVFKLNRMNPLPSFDTFMCIWRNHGLTTKGKIHVTFIGLIMKYVEIWERLQAKLHNYAKY